MYTTTINQNGMILLNKDVRKAMGVKLGDKVMVTLGKDGASVARLMTDEEFFEKMDSMKSEETKRLIKKYAGKTADELFEIAMQKSIAEEMAEGRL